MNILDKIIQEKRNEVAALRNDYSIDELRAVALERYSPRGFAEAIRSCEQAAVIAEFKRGSPSRGMFVRTLEPISTARAFVEAGACCISVLTDANFFYGSIGFVPLIRQHLAKSEIETPLLRKDFIIDPLQVWQSRAIGADAILLIVAALDDTSGPELLDTAFAAELDVLLEIHSSEELHQSVKWISQVYAKHSGTSEVLLGINNRDLKTFVTDLGVTETLAAEAFHLIQEADPALHQIQLISESGIFTNEDIKRLQACAVDGFLIGEALVAKGDPCANLKAILNADEVS